ncbi:MAG: sigma-70 family RNA polymerase sigma factor [Boseongicola sp.]|nr:sigma-70 family RNA polymerase sigma factor [Boseongicola sp.]
MTNVAHLTPSSETSAQADRVGDPELRQQLLDLIGECADENRAAFRRLYDLTSHRVFGIVLAILRNRAAAEEVAQEVYVQIWRQSGGFSSEQANPMGWISSIARNRAIDRLRAERARGFVQFTDDVPDLADTGKDADAPLDTIVLTRALSGLRPEYRKIILLSYYRGYTQSELSDFLDLPLGTVKSWMKRGLAELKEAL